MNSRNLTIDNRWTLFLDRDGVINRRIAGGYVKDWGQFEFLPGVLPALKAFAGIFGRIIVVSNQQGVGKNLMSVHELDQIHDKMIHRVVNAGGRIDAVYFSPHLESEGSVMRKPNVGMALKARKDYQGISFRQSVMAGDSLSDMLFGKRLGMITALISAPLEDLRKGYKLTDLAFPDLRAFADYLSGIRSASPDPLHSPVPPLSAL